MKEQITSSKAKKAKPTNQPTIETWFQNLKHSIPEEKEKQCNPQESKDLIWNISL